MKLTIASLCLAALLATGCSNKENNLNIVPKPVSVEIRNGDFELRPGLKIISNNVFCAEYLKEYLVCAPVNDLSSMIVPIENEDIWKSTTGRDCPDSKPMSKAVWPQI